VEADTSQFGADMFNIGAMIADEKDREAAVFAKISQSYPSILGVPQPKIRGACSQRQHGGRNQSHSGKDDKKATVKKKILTISEKVSAPTVGALARLTGSFGQNSPGCRTNHRQPPGSRNIPWLRAC